MPAALNTLLEPFELEFMQRAALEIALLAPLAGLLGAQIALRGLAFYTHGAGTATFPGLVVAGPLGLPPALAALAAALLFALALERLTVARRIATDAATAIVLVGALALGILLATDAFESGAEVDQLLFGSLLAIGVEELLVTAAALAIGALAALTWRPAWIATGFDPASSRSLRLPAGADPALLAVVAIAVVATLDATGAMLVAAVLVVPAATARLVATRVHRLELGAGGLALIEGLLGLRLAYELDVPPGAAIAVLGGIVFALVAGARAVGRLAAVNRPALEQRGEAA